ncbi:C4b-binding protein alpha chain [Varanus komodoensis]|nr:C4b-binding protein alpha chain [Varanus komodoensis]
MFPVSAISVIWEQHKIELVKTEKGKYACTSQRNRVSSQAKWRIKIHLKSGANRPLAPFSLSPTDAHEPGISCNPPPEIPHGKHTGRNLNDFSYGTAVTYTCEAGYPLVGNASIYCTTNDGINGVWSSRAYCGVTHCPPPLVEKGRIVSSSSGMYTYKQRVTFECLAGHRLTGSRVSHCQVDGTWDPPPPLCETGKYEYRASF